MKKNKKPDQKSRDFEHKPFSSLTASLKQSPAAKKKAPSTPVIKDRNKEESEDEAALFLRAVADVKRKGSPTDDPASPGTLNQTPAQQLRTEPCQEEHQHF